MELDSPPPTGTTNPTPLEEVCEEPASNVLVLKINFISKLSDVFELSKKRTSNARKKYTVSNSTPKKLITISKC